jgi:hypothetical protein
VAHLPLEDLGETPRERKLLGRVGAVIAALVIGAGSGVAVVAWAGAREGRIEAQIKALELGMTTHLAEVKAKVPTMQDANRKLDMLIEDCYRRGGCRK